MNNKWCFVEKANDISFKEFKKQAKDHNIKITGTGKWDSQGIYITRIPFLFGPCWLTDYKVSKKAPDQVFHEFTVNKKDSELLLKEFGPYIYPHDIKHVNNNIRTDTLKYDK